MRIIVQTFFLFVFAFSCLLGAQFCSTDDGKPKILLFTKTEFVFHASTEAAVEAFQELCKKNDWSVDVTDDSDYITEENLSKYSAVVFLNTNGDVLNPSQEILFERYIQAGGGFVGIHTAIDTEHNWKWYGGLVGATFNSKSEVADAILHPMDTEHEAVKHLDSTWKRKDVWFNMGFVDPGVNILLTLDETSYEGGSMGNFHPISWYQDYDGGRSFFTAMGHTPESYSDPAFLQHLLGGLEYAMGDKKPVQFKERRVAPPPNRAGFTKTVLADNLYEPMEFDMFPDGKILFIERRGDFQLFDPETGHISTVGNIPVFVENELGLLGMAIHPDWKDNQWVYVYYSPKGSEQINKLSRFEFAADKLNLESEVVLLEIPVQREECCHQGGSVEFDAQGYLYLSTGDNSSPYGSEGYAPIDEQAGRSAWDAQKSSANTADLRGKILRIKPLPDGSYLCPANNLFTKKDIVMSAGYRMLLDDPLLRELVQPTAPKATESPDFPFLYNSQSQTGGAPEIYVMGCRNPFRISIDSRRNYLFWGDVGPDSGKPDENRGPAGHDEINRAREAGFFGWPYFVGDNKAYVDYDFEQGKPGSRFDAANPVNNSPNNTGAYTLPPAQPAFIWYPFASSTEFPLVTNGTRCAMAGPVYYCDQYPEETRFPDQWDGKLIIYDWMRGWMRAVTLDSLGNYSGMEPFADSVRLSRPIDMLIDKKGSLWVLEYGTEWYHSNPDARLSRIDFLRGNPNDSTSIAGNHPPEVSWDFGRKNRSFYRPGDVIQYRVNVSDKEDGSLRDGRIAASDVNISINYLAAGLNPNKIKQSSSDKKNKNPYEHGKVLIEGSDCKACHATDKQVNGPAYQAIAGRYEKDKSALKVLAEKIIQGGSGNWGHTVMSAHPQVSTKDANDMVRWILSLSDPAYKQPPLQGFYTLKTPDSERENTGTFVFNAAYQDQAWGDEDTNKSSEILLLRPMLQEAEWADSLSKGVRKINQQVNGKPAMLLALNHQKTMVFRRIDLRGISSISMGIVAGDGSLGGARIELRLDKPDGPLVGFAPVPSSTAIQKGSLSTVTLELDQTAWPKNGQLRDIYFVVNNEKHPTKPTALVDWIHFEL